MLCSLRWASSILPLCPCDEVPVPIGSPDGDLGCGPDAPQCAPAHRPADRLGPLGGGRPGAGPARAGVPRRLALCVPDRAWLPGRPATATAAATGPPAVGRGRALGPLVADAG